MRTWHPKTKCIKDKCPVLVCDHLPSLTESCGDQLLQRSRNSGDNDLQCQENMTKSHDVRPARLLGQIGPSLDNLTEFLD